MKNVPILIIAIVLQALCLFGSDATKKTDTIHVYTSQELNDAIIEAANGPQHSTQIIIHGVLQGNFEIPSTNNEIAMIGKGSDAALNGGGTGTTLAVGYGATVSLKDLIILNGAVPNVPNNTVFDQGYGIYSLGTLTVKSCSISSSSPSGILNLGGNLNIMESYIGDNLGQGIISELGYATISHSLIQNNMLISSDYFEQEAGIASIGGVLTVNNSKIQNNNAIGIVLEAGSCVINDSSIKENLSGILNLEGVIEINDSTINGNQSGGINNEGVMTLNGCRLEENTSSGNGGGIFNAHFITINQSILRKNSCSGDGGGIYSDGGFLGDLQTGQLLINDTTIEENYAVGSGGGIYNLSEATLFKTSVKKNSAQVNGGGIVNANPGILTLKNSIVKKNTASGVGGGIYNPNGNLTLIHTEVIENIPDQINL